MLRSDLRLELEGAKDLREAIAYADSVHDYVSRDMMIQIPPMKKGTSTGLRPNWISLAKLAYRTTFSLRSKWKVNQAFPANA